MNALSADHLDRLDHLRDRWLEDTLDRLRERRAQRTASPHTSRTTTSPTSKDAS